MKKCENSDANQVELKSYDTNSDCKSDLSVLAVMDRIIDVRSHGGGGLLSADKGVLQVRTSALFGAKNLVFFEIYGVSARTRGLIQCAQGREGSIFRDFVRTFPYNT